MQTMATIMSASECWTGQMIDGSPDGLHNLLAKSKCILQRHGRFSYLRASR